ncbi:uncharacterized protein LOC123705730 [Colias croceus]|uniref:uncharacterized protein LOC123705730 n=1 Tax=Colias crocea TaxID=72248 RepID=UPI001E27BB30|nr:uncharacterized protein LOC123705730 [Colias croceus]
MEAFIEGVRKQPCLWNPLHPDYREMQIKDEAWQTIVEHYNNNSIPNIQVAKIEWKKLRDNHRDALKRAKLGKNKLLPAQITTWKYAKAMQFLEPHMKYRITENIEMDPPSTNNSINKINDYDVSTTESNDIIMGNSAKRRCIEKSNQYREDIDALESFFKCMLQSTKVMPHWMQTQVKKKIFAVIIEAEEHLSSQSQTDLCELKDQDSDKQLEKKIKCEVFTDESCDNDY